MLVCGALRHSFSLIADRMVVDGTMRFGTALPGGKMREIGRTKAAASRPGPGWVQVWWDQLHLTSRKNNVVDDDRNDITYASID